jgi:hypothetical protein
MTAYLNESEVLAKMSNPNLLINSDFEIKQRGSQTFTTSGKYTADRWVFGINGSGNTGSYDPETKVLTCGTKDQDGYYSYLCQFIENPQKYAGKTLTFSCNALSQEYAWLIQVWYNEPNESVVSLGATAYTTVDTEKTLTFTIPSTITANARLRFLIQTRGTLKVNWAKLEIGDLATTYNPPLIAEELVKCQRYFQVIQTQLARNIFTVNALFYIYLPVTMRINPTATFGSGSGIQLITGGSIDTSYSLNIVTPLKDNCITIRATKDGATYTDLALNLQGNTTLDAEIY